MPNRSGSGVRLAPEVERVANPAGNIVKTYRVEADRPLDERLLRPGRVGQLVRPGEEIVLPIDLSAGSEQEYVEDCPVCCCPNVIHVEIDEHGDVRVWAARE